MSKRLVKAAKLRELSGLARRGTVAEPREMRDYIAERARRLLCRVSGAN